MGITGGIVLGGIREGNNIFTSNNNRKKVTILVIDNSVTFSKAFGKLTVLSRGISNHHQFDHHSLERVTD